MAAQTWANMSVLKIMSEEQLGMMEGELINIIRFSSIRKSCRDPDITYIVSDKVLSHNTCCLDEDLDECWRRIASRDTFKALKNMDRPKASPQGEKSWSDYREASTMAFDKVLLMLRKGEKTEGSPTLTMAVETIFKELDYVSLSLYKVCNGSETKLGAQALKSLVKKYSDGSLHLQIGLILMVAGDLRGKIELE